MYPEFVEEYGKASKLFLAIVRAFGRSGEKLRSGMVRENAVAATEGSAAGPDLGSTEAEVDTEGIGYNEVNEATTQPRAEG